MKSAAIVPYDDKSEFTAEQAALAQVCEREIGRGGLVVIRGYAGTGKSFLVASIVRALEDAGLNYASVCPTGKAAARLRSSGVDAQTIHAFHYVPIVDKNKRLLGFRPRTDHDLPPQFVLIVDEASMVGPTVLHDLIELIHPGAPGRTLILVGDGFQLPPVLSRRELDAVGPGWSPLNRGLYDGAGAHCSDLVDVVRQAADNPLLASATALRTPGGVPPMPDWEHLSVRRIGRAWAEQIAEEGLPADSVMVTWTNRDRRALNERARHGRGISGKALAGGEPLIVLANNSEARLSNGDDLTVLDVVDVAHAGSETVYSVRATDAYSAAPKLRHVVLDTTGEGNVFARARQIEASHKDRFGLPVIADYGYCRTCHKAQGSEWRNVFVYAPPYMMQRIGAEEARRWLYTAITRARYAAHFGGSGDLAYLLGG